MTLGPVTRRSTWTGEAHWGRMLGCVLAATETGADTFAGLSVKTKTATLAAVESADTFAAPIFATHFLTAPMVEGGVDSFKAYSRTGKSLATVAIAVASAATKTVIARATMTVTEGTDTFYGTNRVSQSAASIAIQVQSTSLKTLKGNASQNVILNLTCFGAKKTLGVAKSDMQISVSSHSLMNKGTTAQSNLVLSTTVGVRHCRLTPTFSRASLRESGVDHFG